MVRTKKDEAKKCVCGELVYKWGGGRKRTTLRGLSVVFCFPEFSFPISNQLLLGAISSKGG